MRRPGARRPPEAVPSRTLGGGSEDLLIRPFQLFRFAWGTILVLSACPAPPVSSGAILLLDDQGDTTALAAPARRIVSLIPTTTEILFAIEAGDRIIGRTLWCDYPAAAISIPSLGDGLQPNTELIVAATPDLVILYRSPQNAQAAGRLRSLGIPTIQLRVDRMEDVARATSLLGLATGLVAQADSLNHLVQAEVTAATRTRAEAPGIVVLVWDQPPMVIGAGSFLHELITMVGARNVFEDLVLASAPVSLEAIAARQPDFILTTGETPGYAERPEWQAVSAVRGRRFLHLSGTEFARPTPRVGQALARLGRALDSALAP